MLKIDLLHHRVNNGRAFSLFLGGICLAIASVGSAQTEKPEQASADVDHQKQWTAEIYQLTQSASTAKDYSVLLDKCDAAISQSLTPKNQAYVVSLKGWALNRRGVQRFELAQQLKRVGNAQHREIMEQALGDFDDAIVSDPARYRSFMSRGIAHMELFSDNEFGEDPETKEPEPTDTIKPHLKRAILDFTKVTELKADESNGWFNRAEAFYYFGSYEKAINDYNVVLRLKSDDSQALTGRGHARLALGQTQQALEDYEQVVELQSENPTAFINRGDALAKLGEWEQSQADYEKSVAIKQSGIALQRLAWLKATCPEASFRNPEDALELIARAIEMDGDSPVNLETLAAAEASIR